MANSGKKTQKKKTPEKSASACGETIVKEKATGSLPKENGDLRTAIVDVLRNDDAVMQTIIDAVSEALVSKLLASKTFMSTLADKLLSNGALNSVKQSIYEASAMDNSRTYATVTAMEGKLTALDSNNKALSDEMDALEQYSRRNCLLFHGVPETDADTTDSVISLCQGKLDVNVTRELVDRSHRLGQRHVGPSGEYKPRPIIVKFRSYETRRSVFSAKRRLKGTKYVVTENLTRRRNDLLKKVRSLDTISCAWTTDGRIVCLLGDERKVTVLHERDIDTLSTGR